MKLQFQKQSALKLASWIVHYAKRIGISPKQSEAGSWGKLVLSQAENSEVKFKTQVELSQKRSDVGGIVEWSGLWLEIISDAKYPE